MTHATKEILATLVVLIYIFTLTYLAAVALVGMSLTLDLEKIQNGALVIFISVIANMISFVCIFTLGRKR